jgi:hypothetical protein
MPLRVGRSWSYLARAGFDTYVTQLQASKQVPVAGTRGVELTSDLGASHMAWVGNALVADRLINAQFEPPLPLVYSTAETYERPWKGKVTFIETSWPARATQSQSTDDDLTFEGHKLHCVRSVVKLQSEKGSIELITWFSDGIGIVQQEQRTDGKLVLKLELLKEKK